MNGWDEISAAVGGPVRERPYPTFSQELARNVGSQPVPRYGSTALKIYLAGAVGQHCWRERLVSGLHGAICSGDAPRDAIVNLELELGRHTYVGPYFVACDHGCGHGSTEHGVGASGNAACLYDALTRPDVRRLCRAQISKAHLVFAWIDRPDVYGTLWELGYAAALGKQIVVRWPIAFDISEMWLSLSEDARPVADVVAAFQESLSAPQEPLALPVDSPIEAMLRDVLAPLVEGRFTLKTRHMAGGYKLDFALWNEKKNWRIAVECDGHEFHEKTKEQAARDRARERDLVFGGWTVLRFTGSEIYRDSKTCAQDVLRHCLRLDAQ